MVSGKRASAEQVRSVPALSSNESRIYESLLIWQIGTQDALNKANIGEMKAKRRQALNGRQPRAASSPRARKS
jgi:hypothetical protein